VTPICSTRFASFLRSLLMDIAHARACKNGATPLDLATDKECRDTLEHHAGVLLTVNGDPESLIAAAINHCASLSGYASTLSEFLTLKPYHYNSFSQWVPPVARETFSSFARDVFTAQVAANTQCFSGLPDDCAGDVLELLTTTTLERTMLLEVITSCSSPEACAWVRAVVDDIVVVSAYM